MCEFRALLPHPEARACRDAVDVHARAAKETGDPRPIGMLRAGAAADLILRAWQDQPPVTAHLTGLPALPDSGAAFTAVPVAVRGMATFPVRAFATVGRPKWTSPSTQGTVVPRS